MDGGTLAFDNIFMHGRTVKSSGKLKLAHGGIGWKEAATGLVTTLKAEEFKRLSWLRVARDHQLRIQTSNGQWHRFDGFPSEAFDSLSGFAKKSYELSLEPRELSLKGHNWGRTEITGSNMEFKVGTRTAFELPLLEVANVAVATKNELAIEFATLEGQDRKLDALVEIRFYVPGTVAAEGEDVEGEEIDAAQAICDTIKSVSELNAVTGDSIVSLPEMPCIVPRGRYEIEMATSYMRFHGKTYDYKILYTSIVKLFMLPKPDDVHVLFVIALDPPIRQGQTRYPFVVLQFAKDDELAIELNLDEEAIKVKYDGKLESSYEAPTFEVVSTLFRVLTGQKIIVPGSFKSSTGLNSLRCSVKANEGYLFPLEKNFIFLPKPTTLIPHADIGMVHFSRVGSGSGNSRTFDIKFALRNGTELAFANLPKEDYVGLEEFLRLKNIAFREEAREEPIRGTSYEESESGSGLSDDDDELASKRLRSAGEEESSPDEDYMEGEDEEDEELSGDDEDFDSEAGTESDASGDSDEQEE